MLVDDATSRVGEIRCLNCGRMLGESVRSPATGKLRLRPAADQRTISVSVIAGQTLRCNRCEGRAFIEPLRWASPDRDRSSDGSVVRLFGTA